VSGPRYLICGSSLTTADTTPLLRLILEGLNTQARQWSETITVLDDLSLPGLEGEVEDFRHLEHRRFDVNLSTLTMPNIVIAFMNRLSHNRDTEQLLRHAESQGIPAFCISTYGV
jgi:hypothetical protein